MNNPLRYTDHSGHCATCIIPPDSSPNYPANVDPNIDVGAPNFSEDIFAALDNLNAFAPADSVINILGGKGPKLSESLGGFFSKAGKWIKGLFTSTDEASHAVASAKQAQSILDGIDPQYFNSNSMFGGGFYLAQNGETAVTEVAAHGADAKYVVTFKVNFSGQKVLDLTNADVAKAWGFDINADISTHQALAAKAIESGYNAIISPSLRGSGSNYIILAILMRFYLLRWLCQYKIELRNDKFAN